MSPTVTAPVSVDSGTVAVMLADTLAGAGTDEVAFATSCRAKRAGAGAGAGTGAGRARATPAPKARTENERSMIASVYERRLVDGSSMLRRT